MPQIISYQLDYIKSCYVLPSCCVLVDAYTIFSFYSSELDHVKDVKLEEIVEGLTYGLQFKHLNHSQRVKFILLSEIEDLETFEEKNIKHTYTGTETENVNSIMMEVGVDENISQHQINHNNLEDNKLLLSNYYAEHDCLIELGAHKFMLGQLIIDHFKVVRKV